MLRHSIADNKSSRWHRLLAFANVVEIVLTLIASLFLALYVIAQLDSTPPIRFEYSDKEVTTSSDGKSFFVRRRTCLSRALPAIALPRLASENSDVLIPLPTKPLSALVGCHSYDVLVLIPDEVPPGRYAYRMTYRFDMNPFKTLDVQAPPVIVNVAR